MGIAAAPKSVAHAGKGWGDTMSDIDDEFAANDILIAKGEVVITGGDVLGVAVTEVLKSVYTN